jgi:hypothetical protein
MSREKEIHWRGGRCIYAFILYSMLASIGLLICTAGFMGFSWVCLACNGLVLPLFENQPPFCTGAGSGVRTRVLASTG